MPYVPIGTEPREPRHLRVQPTNGREIRRILRRHVRFDAMCFNKRFVDSVTAFQPLYPAPLPLGRFPWYLISCGAFFPDPSSLSYLVTTSR